MCQCSYYIVGLVSRDFKHGNVVSLQYLLYLGHGKAYCLGCLLALSLVFGKRLVAEGAAMWVKGHTKVCGAHVAQHILQGVHKAQDGTCVLALGVVSWIFDESIVGSVDESICIQKEQFHNYLSYLPTKILKIVIIFRLFL